MNVSKKRLRIGCLATTALAAIIGGYFLWRYIQSILIAMYLEYEVGFLARATASDNDGFYAALSSEPGRLMYDFHDLFPDFDPDPKVFIHPQHRFPIPEGLTREERCRLIIDDHSWFYTGYLITNDTEALAFESAYRKRVAAGGDFTTDLQVPEGKGNFGTSTIFRLRADMDEFLIEQGIEVPEHLHDLRAPIVVQRPSPEQPEKWLWVYILPGFVDKVPVGTFPASREMLNVLTSLDTISTEDSPP